MSQSLPLQPSLRPSEGGIRQQEAKRDIIATMEARKIEARRRYQQRQQQLHLEGEEKRQGLLGTTNFAATSPTDSTIATRVATTTATSTVVTQSPYQDDMLYAGIEARKLEARKRFQQRQQQRQSAMSRYPSTTATATATATAITTMDKIQDEEELVSTFETYDEEELISILTDARKAFAEKRNATYWSVITPRQICTIAKLAPVTLDELRKVGMSDEKVSARNAKSVNGTASVRDFHFFLESHVCSQHLTSRRTAIFSIYDCSLKSMGLKLSILSTCSSIKMIWANILTIGASKSPKRSVLSASPKRSVLSASPKRSVLSASP